MTGTEMYDAIAHMDEELIEGCIARKKARSSERRALAAKKACLGEEKRPSAFKRAALACAAIVAVIALAIGMVALLHIGGKSPVQIAPVGSDAPAPTEAPEETQAPEETASPIPTAEPITVPEGYNEHDYDALAAFLETESDGKKNGRRLNPGYDPAYPNTWTYKRWEETVELAKWDEEGYLIGITALVEGYKLAGKLDLSGCERLDRVEFSSESITALDLTGCPLKKGVTIMNSALESLLPDPLVTPRLSVSNAGLSYLHWVAVPDEEMNGNALDFDLELFAEGEGAIGIFMPEVIENNEITVFVMAAEGWHFIGWYDEDGQVISHNEAFAPSDLCESFPEDGRLTGSYAITARFEEGRAAHVETFNHFAYIDAMTRLMNGEKADEVWDWTNKTCDVILVLEEDAFRAYGKMTLYPADVIGELDGDDGEMYTAVCSEVIAEYPREVGEEALNRLYGEIPKENGFDMWGVGPYMSAEGFAGEDWFVLKTVDDSIQDIQFHCIFVKGANGEWHEVDANDKQMHLPVYGACMLDENVGFLCYNCKFLDGPDETYRDLYVFRTVDGGKTWRDTGLVLPEEYGTVYPGSCLSPVFDGDHGAMLVNAYRYDESLEDAPYEARILRLWYETYDGGKTWTLHDEKKRGAAGSGVASWPVDTDGDGIDELFCVDAGLMQRDAFSRAWLEDGSGRVLGNPIYCGSASVAQGTFAVVESPEYGVCIMRLMPEFEGEEFGYMLYKCVSGSLECVYRETLWSYSGEEGDEPPSKSEAKDYERRVNELLSSGRVLFSCDSWGAMHRDFYNIKTNKSLKDVIDGKTFFISTYNSAGRTGELEDVLDGETALVLDVPVGYRFVYEPFCGGPAE